jgi:hypothetical protein
MSPTGKKARLQQGEKRRLADAHPWQRSTPETRVPPTPPGQVLAAAKAKRASRGKP